MDEGSGTCDHELNIEVHTYAKWGVNRNGEGLLGYVVRVLLTLLARDSPLQISPVLKACTQEQIIQRT